MQRVVGNVEFLQICPDLGLAPVGERVELDHAACGVEFLDRERRARHSLLASLAGDPGLATLQRPLERFHLADVAATPAQFLAFVKGIAAEFRDVFGDRRGVGAEYLDVVAVAPAHRIDHVERVGMEPAGVERENPDVEPVPQYRVGEHHVLGGKAGRERCGSMLERSPREHAPQLFDSFRESLAHGFPTAGLRRNSGTGRRYDV